MYILGGDDVRSDLVFLAHPRTASTAIKRALEEMGDVQRVKSHHGMDADQIPNDAIVFAVVRNPWDLFISWWFKRRAERSPFYGKPLEEFMPLFRRHNEQYFRGGKLFYMSEYTNQILSYEHLQAQFDVLIVGLGYAPQAIGMVNKSEERPAPSYREHYTPAAQRWVAETFAEEIEKYGYQF